MRKLIVAVAIALTVATNANAQTASYTNIADCSLNGTYALCESNAGLVKVSAMDGRYTSRITSGRVKLMRDTRYTLTTDAGAKFDIQLKAAN